MGGWLMLVLRNDGVGGDGNFPLVLHGNEVWKL